MEWVISPAGKLAGEARVPGDKSISHRAALLGALAEGRTEITNFLAGADCLSTLACLRQMGIEVDQQGDRVAVLGGGGALAEPPQVLDCGNSGTTMRLLTGCLAGQRGYYILNGDESLRRRPMDRVVKPLRAMGAQIWGRQGDSRAPLAIKGADLVPAGYHSPVASAQVKSAVLLAGLYAPGVTEYVEPHLSRDHSERMLAAFGARLEREGTLVRLWGGQEPLQAQRVEVPGDISSAAFLLVAGSIVPRGEVWLPGVGVNPTRSGVLEALRLMGADIREENRRTVSGEPVADLLVRPAPLHGVQLGGALIPRLIDEVPVLAVAAAVAAGTTIVRDAAELRVKESDRVATLAAELRRLGVAMEELPDGLSITGGQLTGAACDSHADHRLAMALAVAGLAAAGETRIAGAECSDVSFPGFRDTLSRLADTL